MGLPHARIVQRKELHVAEGQHEVLEGEAGLATTLALQLEVLNGEGIQSLQETVELPLIDDYVRDGKGLQVSHLMEFDERNFSAILSLLKVCVQHHSLLCVSEATVKTGWPSWSPATQSSPAVGCRFEMSRHPHL